MASPATQARGSGRAKLILFGEHSVVYGKPAVAAGLPRGARASARPADSATSHMVLRDGQSDEVYADVVPDPDGPLQARSFAAILDQFEPASAVDVDVCIEVPIGVGLGSSAAMAVATARAIAALFDQPERVDAAVEASEGVFHGTPSGIDQMAATDGGLFIYWRDQRTDVAPIDAPPLTLAVCQAGPAASTAEIVGNVAARKEREGQLVDYLNQLVGDTARAASGALADGNWARVGELMDINHGALAALGVTTAALDAACHTARQAGALGAKLTGAGGGGCVYALTPDGADDVLAAWQEHGWSGFEVTIPG